MFPTPFINVPHIESGPLVWECGVRMDAQSSLGSDPVDTLCVRSGNTEPEELLRARGSRVLALEPNGKGV